MGDNENPASNLPIGFTEMLQGDLKLARILGIVAAVMLVSSVALMPMGGKFFNVGLIVVLLAVLPALLASITWSRCRSVKRRTLALCGDHLVHWTYSPEEWQSFDETSTAGRPAGEAYIGAETGYFNQLFFEWNGFGATLVDVSFKDDSRTELDFVIFYANPKTGGTKLIYRIPIPRGRQDEANQLVETLRKGKKIVGLKSPMGVLWIVVFVATAAAALAAGAVSLGFVK